jgi:hypothetical protein
MAAPHNALEAKQCFLEFEIVRRLWSGMLDLNALSTFDEGANQ